MFACQCTPHNPLIACTAQEASIHTSCLRHQRHTMSTAHGTLSYPWREPCITQLCGWSDAVRPLFPPSLVACAPIAAISHACGALLLRLRLRRRRRRFRLLHAVRG